MKTTTIGREVQSDYPAGRLLLGGRYSACPNPVACGNFFSKTGSRLNTDLGTFTVDGGSKEDSAARYVGRLMGAVVIAIVEQFFRFFQIVDIIVFIVK